MKIFTQSCTEFYFDKDCVERDTQSTKLRTLHLLELWVAYFVGMTEQGQEQEQGHEQEQVQWQGQLFSLRSNVSLLE